MSWLGQLWDHNNSIELNFKICIDIILPNKSLYFNVHKNGFFFLKCTKIIYILKNIKLKLICTSMNKFNIF